MSALVTATRANEAWGSGMDGDGHLERTTIEQECDLMVEALCRELDGIKVRRGGRSAELAVFHRAVPVLTLLTI